MRIVITPATSAVAVAINARLGPSPPPRNLPSSSCTKPMMRGLSTMMYAIVKKVTTPPRISRLTVDPRSVILKYRSTPLVAVGADDSDVRLMRDNLDPQTWRGTGHTPPHIARRSAYAE